jgi:hypothetical protein
MRKVKKIKPKKKEMKRKGTKKFPICSLKKKRRRKKKETIQLDLTHSQSDELEFQF